MWALLDKFNRSIYFIIRLNRDNFYFSRQSFKILWLISGIEFRKTQTFSSISQKLCQLSQKHWDKGVNNTIGLVQPADDLPRSRKNDAGLPWWTRVVTRNDTCL